MPNGHSSAGSQKVGHWQSLRRSARRLSHQYVRERDLGNLVGKPLIALSPPGPDYTRRVLLRLFREWHAARIDPRPCRARRALAARTALYGELALLRSALNR